MGNNAIRPKLVVSDATAAVDFYRSVLGAEVVSCFQLAERVVFAELEVLGTSITLKDADEHDPVPTPGTLLDVVVDDPDSVAATMLSAGAESVFPVADQPYGARGGRVQDPYGVQWLLQTPVSMTPDQWQKLVEEAGGKSAHHN